MNADRFHFFNSVHLESDLQVGVTTKFFDQKMKKDVIGEQQRLYDLLEAHFSSDPDFMTSLDPLALPVKKKLASELVDMMKCGLATGTGPMSSVAGLFAKKTGELLLAGYNPPELVIENGGDLWICNKEELLAGIYAGSSPFSEKIALAIPPGTWGVCSSSGVFGHSYSRGKADVVTVVCRDATLADAWATSLANMIGKSRDVDIALEKAGTIPEILSCIVVAGDKLGIRGDLDLRLLA